MGIFDSLMQGESSGMPDSMPTGILNQTGWQSALEGNNPLLNIGLGILANNSGNYGSAFAALGKGTQQGVQNTQASRKAQIEQGLYKMKLDEAKKALDDKKKQQEWLKTYGQPNANQETTTQAPDTWQNAMQGHDAPNFNMERVAGQTTTTQTPYFDQNKSLLEAVQNGAIDFKDYLTMVQKDKPKFGQTPQYDQQGNAFVLDESGNIKRLDGIKERQELLVTPSGMAINKNDPTNIGKTFNADDNNPNKPFIMVGGQVVPNKDFQDYELRKAGAGAARTNVSVNNKISEKGFTKLAELDAATINDMGIAAKQAREALPMVDRMIRNEGNAYSGIFAPGLTGLAQAADALGFATPELKNKLVSTQLFSQGAEAYAASMLKALMGSTALSNADLATVKKIAPRLADSPEARREIMLYARKRISDIQDEYQGTRNYYDKNNASLTGFNPPIAPMPEAPVIPQKTSTLNALPMPEKPSALTLKRGGIYQTQKGALKWNGKSFEDL